MQRVSSSASLKLLDPDLTDEDVFNPPAWLPGHFLQFTDISLDDEQSPRPLSALDDRLVPSHEEDTSEDSGSFRAETSSDSFVIHMRRRSFPRSQPIRALLPSWSRSRVTLIVTSCMTVALTALTLLTFVL